VNARQARELKGVLGVVYPGATDIQVAPDSDGARVVLSGIRAADNSEPGGGDVMLDIGNADGPVLRMILSGRV
jgi:hypothetical protein